MRDEAGDGLPWYRYFWPWFIVGLLAMSVGASLITVAIAFRVEGARPIAEDETGTTAPLDPSGESLPAEAGKP